MKTSWNSQTDVKGSSTDGAMLRVKRIVLDVNIKIKTHKYVLLIIQKALAFWTSFEIQCVKLFYVAFLIVVWDKIHVSKKNHAPNLKLDEININQ